MNLDASQGYLGTRRKWLVVAGLVIVVGLAIWAWFDIIRYQIVPKRFGVVEQGRIYRSGQISAPLIKKILTKYNIRVIIDLSSADPNNHDKQAEKQVAAELNIKVLRFSMSGNGTGDVNDYAGAVAAIATKPGRVSRTCRGARRTLHRSMTIACLVIRRCLRGSHCRRRRRY